VADILAPAPAREALIQPGAIITPPWQRWLSDVARQLGQAQVDLAVLRRDVDALRSDLDAFEALVATLQAELDALAAQVAALVQPQTTTLTVAVSGAAGLTFAAMAPAGAQVVGVTWRIVTTFTGTLTGLLVGDSVVADRWGVAAAVTAGTTGSSTGWRGQGGFTVPSAYQVLAQPVGAGYGAAGALTCQCTWWPALLPPP
jgi:hypothetical protein